MKLNISNKIFLSNIVIGILSIIILSAIFYNILKDSLIQRTIDQLSSVNILKKNHIENYFNEREKELNRIYLSLSDTLTKDNIADKIEYLKKDYDFESVFALNQNYRIFSRGSDTTELSSAASYIINLPLNEAKPVTILDVSFLSGKKKTFILFLIRGHHQTILIKDNFQKIETMLKERTGMGSSGETYLVGKDFLMRSSSRFFPDKPPLTIKVETEASKYAVKKNKKQNIIEDYRNIKVLSVYRKIDSSELDWAIISEMDFSEAMKPIIKLRNYIIIIFILILAAILFSTKIVSDTISKPILKLKTIILSLSKGILPVEKIAAVQKDEIGEITMAINQLIEGLKRTESFASEIGSGNLNASFIPLSAQDTLGQSLIKMREDLKKIKEYESSIIKEKNAALLEGQENERKRISRELHDGIGQLLTAINLRLQQVEGQDEVKSEIKSLLNQTIAEVRRISYNIMPGALVDFGLEAALNDFVQNIKKHSGIKVNFTYEKEAHAPEVNFEIRIAAFRTVQEALNNILKHANASEIDLNVRQNTDELLIDIRDNGKGFKIDEAVKGLGLKNMKERIEILDGIFNIYSEIAKRTEIKIKIPIKK
jgi:two-component system, NarL family, sensor kinase